MRSPRSLIKEIILVDDASERGTVLLLSLCLCCLTDERDLKSLLNAIAAVKITTQVKLHLALSSC